MDFVITISSSSSSSFYLLYLIYQKAEETKKTYFPTRNYHNRLFVVHTIEEQKKKNGKCKLKKNVIFMYSKRITAYNTTTHIHNITQQYM